MSYFYVVSSRMENHLDIIMALVLSHIIGTLRKRIS